MTDLYKPLPADSAAPHHDPVAPPSNDAGRTLLAGVVGGVVSAVGYLIYTRLPEDQKDTLHAQVRTVVESRVNELRSRFNV
jgi:hypothetical protein